MRTALPASPDPARRRTENAMTASAAVLWIIVAVGPDFIIPARWATLVFDDRTHCRTWLADALLSHGAASKMRFDVQLECRAASTIADQIEE
jgi:hypothetical protein